MVDAACAPFSLPALTSAGFADAALRQIKGAEVANGDGVVISAHRGGGTVFGTQSQRGMFDPEGVHSSLRFNK
jgi:hypothetical protein